MTNPTLAPHCVATLVEMSPMPTADLGRGSPRSRVAHGATVAARPVARAGQGVRRPRRLARARKADRARVLARARARDRRLIRKPWLHLGAMASIRWLRPWPKLAAG